MNDHHMLTGHTSRLSLCLFHALSHWVTNRCPRGSLNRPRGPPIAYLSPATLLLSRDSDDAVLFNSIHNVHNPVSWKRVFIHWIILDVLFFCFSFDTMTFSSIFNTIDACVSTEGTEASTSLQTDCGENCSLNRGKLFIKRCMNLD